MNRDDDCVSLDVYTDGRCPTSPMIFKILCPEKVDEKYYIKNEKANKLIKQLIDGGVLPEQNRTEQNRTEQIVSPIDLSVNGGLVNISACICARYDCGIIRHKNEHTGILSRI